MDPGHFPFINDGPIMFVDIFRILAGILSIPVDFIGVRDGGAGAKLEEGYGGV